MAKVSFWTHEFLEEVVEALDVSLGRVSVDELRSDPKAAKQWREAQAWREEAERVVERPSSDDIASSLPPFPLTGEELRSLQRAVDRAAKDHPKDLKAEGADLKAERMMNVARAQSPLTAHGRLLQTLERVRFSSWVLAALLVAIFVLNIVEWLFFPDAELRLVLGVGALLSALAIALWWTHHRHITHHMDFVSGMRAHV